MPCSFDILMKLKSKLLIVLLASRILKRTPSWFALKLLQEIFSSVII